MKSRISSRELSGLTAVLVIVGTFYASTIGLGPLTAHMISHILLMNAAAPLLALLARHFVSSDVNMPIFGTGLLLPAVGQICVLWSLHTPYGMQIAMQSPFANLASQVALFVVALWFWWNIFNVPRSAFWRPALALALTGKFYCLLGAVLVFAPRLLYAHDHTPIFEGGPLPDAEALADQQLAGLLMLVACPATYMLAGVTISARGLFALDESRIRIAAG